MKDELIQTIINNLKLPDYFKFPSPSIPKPMNDEEIQEWLKNATASIKKYLTNNKIIY